MSFLLDGTWKRHWVAFALLTLGPGLSGMYGCFACRPDQGWPMERFEPERWRTAPKDTRYMYTRDLEQRGLLKQLNRDEVIALLGPPRL